MISVYLLLNWPYRAGGSCNGDAVGKAFAECKVHCRFFRCSTARLMSVPTMRSNVNA